jgi:hypothetical protein
MIPAGDHVACQLKSKNFNDLRDDARMIPIILAVLLVPVDDALWLEHRNDDWVSRYGCYWADLRGQPPLPDDAESKVVHIPKNQRLTVAELRRVMTNVSRTSRV